MTNSGMQMTPEEAQQEIMDSALHLKRSLKRLSKNQLIQLLVQQVNFSTEQQNVNKVLLERLQKFEGNKDE